MSKMYLFYMLAWCLMVGIQATSLCMSPQDGVDINQSLQSKNKSVAKLTLKKVLKKIKNLDSFGKLKFFASSFVAGIGIGGFIVSGAGYGKWVFFNFLYNFSMTMRPELNRYLDAMKQSSKNKQRKFKSNERTIVERRNFWQKAVCLSSGVAVVGVSGAFYSLLWDVQYN